MTREASPAWSLVFLIALVVAFSISCSEVDADDGALAKELDVQAAVEDFLRTHDVPGVSVSIKTKDMRITAVGGLEDVAQEKPVTPQSIFRLASTTKVFISALAMKLVESGTLDLEDRASRWVRNLPSHLGSARHATLEQLLSHTSGLPQTFTRDDDRGQPLYAAELLDRIPPPLCEPGECWVYGDGNFILVGLIIEEATRQPLADAISDRVLQPLGLDDTLTTSQAPPAAVIAPQYRLRVDTHGQPVKPVQYIPMDFPRWEVAGTLAATASDLADFGSALFGGRVVTMESLDQMIDTRRSRGLPCPEGCLLPYGLGILQYQESGRTMFGHDGSSGSLLAHDPTDGLTIALLTNGGDQDMGDLLRAVLEALE